MIKKILLLLIAVSVFSCGKKENQNTQTNTSSNTGNAPIKVGLVFDVGGRGDKSFNDAAYAGLEKAQKELGIEFEDIDPGNGSDRESALRKFAARPDIALIFGVGFIFTDDINNVAKEFPNKKFACIDYSITDPNTIPPNVLAVEFKEEEGSFLVGAIAGLKTSTNKIGFIGGVESPLIKKFETGYVQGAKYSNPNIEVFTSYISVTPDGFKNPGKAQEIALSQYTKGADIIYHASGLSGLGLFEAAKEQKKFAIGVDMDQWNEAPGQVITSMIKQVSEAIYGTIKLLKEGQFKGGIKVFGLSDNGIGYVYDDNNKSLLSKDIIDKVEAMKEKIKKGEITIK
ncbi:MAG TPA: BMP family ABC transporter substrate-binding protein [Ignavibacteria bacterium]|nr:BMP family ABC transporter substrate-binding protein [Ignavibacteria bacterium]